MRLPAANAHVSEDATGWRQLPLFPCDDIVLEVRIGVVLSADHVQAQLKVSDAETAELVAMRSWPHFGFAHIDEQMAYVMQTALEDLHALLAH